MHVIPALMPRDYETRSFEFMYQVLHGSRPGPYIGAGQVAQIGGLHAFYQAAAVQDLFLRKPDNDVIGSMSRAGKIRLEFMVPQLKRSIVFQQEFRAFLVVFDADFVCLAGGVGSNSFAAVILQTAGAVFMRVGGNAHRHPAMVPVFNRIEQRLELGSIPGGVDHQNACGGDEVKSVCRHQGILVGVEGRKNVKIARQTGDLQRPMRRRLGKKEGRNAEENARGNYSHVEERLCRRMFGIAGKYAAAQPNKR